MEPTRAVDFELIVDNARRGFEIKGWTAKTWREALDAAVKRMNKGASALNATEKQAVKKVDHMIKQLLDIQSTTKKIPILGLTDELPKDLKGALRDVLKDAGVSQVKIVPLSESEIKEAAAGVIGAPLGIPRP